MIVAEHLVLHSLKQIQVPLIFRGILHYGRLNATANDLNDKVIKRPYAFYWY